MIDWSAALGVTPMGSSGARVSPVYRRSCRPSGQPKGFHQNRPSPTTSTVPSSSTHHHNPRHSQRFQQPNHRRHDASNQRRLHRPHQPARCLPGPHPHPSLGRPRPQSPPRREIRLRHHRVRGYRQKRGRIHHHAPRCTSNPDCLPRFHPASGVEVSRDKNNLTSSRFQRSAEP